MDISSIPDELFSFIESVWVNRLVSEAVKNIMFVVGSKAESWSDVRDLLNSYIQSVFYDYPDIIKLFGLKSDKEKINELEAFYKKVFE